MRLVSLKCPHCKAELEFKDNNKTILYCPYCGSKLMLDDGVQRTEKTVNINKTVRNIFERYDNAEVERTRREQIKAESENAPFIFAFLLFLIAALLFGGAAFHHYYTVGQLQKEGAMQIPHTEKEYKGTDYRTVVNELESIGFTNITVNPDYDLWFSNDSKKYTVKTMSVNGSSTFGTTDYYFLPDAPIVITYHDAKSNRPNE